jgi:hypothetical protein
MELDQLTDTAVSVADPEQQTSLSGLMKAEPERLTREASVVNDEASVGD